jgi:pimeloyl-ACP methyl ester carboxylesterase
MALGDSRLTYLGISYGTHLGATYVNLFPRRVRALVLDGAVDPVERATGRDDDDIPMFLRVGSHVDAAQTLEEFLRLCADARPTACAFAVGTNRRATADGYDRVMTRLRMHPLPATTPTGTVVKLTYCAAIRHERSAKILLSGGLGFVSVLAIDAIATMIVLARTARRGVLRRDEDDHRRRSKPPRRRGAHLVSRAFRQR